MTSTSGTRDCAGGSFCEFNVTGYTFNESFTAVARPGYVFSRWGAGDEFLCANSTNPTCKVNNTRIAPHPDIDGIIASDQIFYAVPIFIFVGIDTDNDGIKNHLDADDDDDGVLDVYDNCPLAGPNLDVWGCPIADTVIVGGRRWYQPDVFQNITRSEIEAVCPSTDGGVCIDGGRLRGKDMTGWTWATHIDFGDHIGSLFPGTLFQSSCGDEFRESGWAQLEEVGLRPYRAVYQGPQPVGIGFVGYLQGELIPGAGFVGFVIHDYGGGDSCLSGVDTEPDFIDPNLSYIWSGWFYRDY